MTERLIQNLWKVAFGLAAVRIAYELAIPAIPFLLAAAAVYLLIRWLRQW